MAKQRAYSAADGGDVFCSGCLSEKSGNVSQNQLSF